MPYSRTPSVAECKGVHGESAQEEDASLMGVVVAVKLKDVLEVVKGMTYVFAMEVVDNARLKDAQRFM